MAEKLLAQQQKSAKIVVTGKIIARLDKQPVDYATIVVLETRSRVRVQRGFYRIELPGAGSYTFKFFDTAENQKQRAEQGQDPLLNGVRFKNSLQFHNQAITYNYHASEKLQNKIVLYSSFNDGKLFLDNPQEEAFALNLNVVSRPNVFGLKDRLKFSWLKNVAELRTGLVLTYARFTANGNTIARKKQSDIFDIGDSSFFDAVALNEKHENYLVGSYIENQFSWQNFIFTPGVRSDYLHLTRVATFDPRALLSYEFVTKTTLSLAYGKYSAFAQNNPNWFQGQPKIASARYLGPSKSIHRVAAIEQKLKKLFTLRLEAFYNDF